MIEILQTSVLAKRAEGWLAEHFRVHRWPDDAAARRALLAEAGPRIRGIATIGSGPVDASLIAALPALEIISSFTAGVEGIDVEAAAARGVRVTNTSAALADAVAEVGIALTMMLVRGLVRADRFVRRGDWETQTFRQTRGVTGTRLGIVGLGHIGKAVAAKASALGMVVGYHGPRRKPDVEHEYFQQLHELAQWAEVLLLSCPGGEGTRHLVDAEVLTALGEEGFLINLARGSVVDEAALIDALRNQRIAGAGLDVYADEPHVPEALKQDDRVILLPHMASGTLATREAMGRLMVRKLVEALKP